MRVRDAISGRHRTDGRAGAGAPPLMDKKTVGKMGLKGVPGLRLRALPKGTGSIARLNKAKPAGSAGDQRLPPRCAIIIAPL